MQRTRKKAASVIKPFDRAVEFHGHVCPGLAIGYRMAGSSAYPALTYTPEDGNGGPPLIFSHISTIQYNGQGIANYINIVAYEL
jgi:hypothetical protein